MWSPAKSPRVPRLSRVLRYDFGLSRLRWNRCPACLGITVQLRLESLSSLYRNSQFENHAILREAWETTRQVIDEEHAEALQYAAERAHQQKVESHIVAGNWPELGMPTPAEALNTLLAGEELEANGHTAFYDNTDGITWCVNPYGVDGILCNGQPTLQRVISFLKDMARGKEYGPVPY